MKLSIEIHSDRRWSYALAGTRRPLVKRIILKTDGAIPDRDYKVVPRVTLDFPTPEPVAKVWTANVPRDLERRGPHVGEPIEWDRIELKIDSPLLGRLQDKVRGLIRVEIVDVDTNEVMASATQDLELLAPNEFRQEGDYMDVIAAFVLPTDPYVSEILAKARQLLHERTGDSSTQGYQAGHERVQQIAKAVYDAMASMGYDYSNPPGYFEFAQRVRTPSQIKQENCATCLDSAVLMASCFAQAGLEPVLFMIHGHAFAGYFTAKPVQTERGILIGDGAVDHWLQLFRRNRLTQLLRSRHLGNIQTLLQEGYIQPVETTTTTRGMQQTFEEACQRQNNFSVVPNPLTGTDDSTLESIVIVQLAWQDGITPPVVIIKGTGEPLEPWKARAISDGSLPDSALQLDDPTLSDEERAIPPRIRQWMASLLDLSSKNPLLKIRPTQLMEFDVPGSVLGSLDDLLHKPKGRIKLPYFSALPVNWIHNGVTSDEFEKWSQGEASLVYPSYRELNKIHTQIERELAKYKASPEYSPSGPADAEILSRLRQFILSNYSADLTKAAKKQIDKANDIMLLTGNNSLYLALGTMSWTENSDFRGKATSTDWCAPLYLYPVILEGGKGRPWSLKLDPKSEITPNFCLHEKLKRPPYNIDLQELVNPEEDEHGINLEKMIKVIRQRLAIGKFDNFSVQSRAVLGAFNYSNFRLWKDLRDDWKRLTEISPVFKHLAYTSNVPFEGNPPIPVDRLEPLLPIAADDSQRDAIQLALDGQSFKLEGPPGTGKSQTITNLLASCIAHNKKVLFVAEKQTALNAVKERLDKTGLGTFTLNLHAKGDSDTKLRKNIAAALNNALRANIDPRDNAWDEANFRLTNERNALDRYRASLHEPGADGFSTWEANEQLLEVGVGQMVELPPHFVSRFPELWPAVQSAALALEAAFDLVPNPSQHPWRFLGLAESPIDLSHLTELLQSLLSAAERLTTGPERESLRTAVDEKSIPVIGSVIKLSAAGFLPSANLLTQLLTENNPADEFGRKAVEFLAGIRALQEAIARHTQALSTDFFNRSDFEELRNLLARNDPDALQSELEAMKVDWSSLALKATTLPDPHGQQAIAPTAMPMVTQALANVESTSDNTDFNQFVQSIRAILVKAQDHESSVGLEILERTDVAELEFRVKAADEAGVLVRSRKVKTLRDLLGPVARTTDDRLLVSSVGQMIAVVRELREVMNHLRVRFPEIVVDGVRFWVPTEMDRFAGELRRVRLRTLRDLNLVSSAPSDDQSFLAMVRTLADLSPLMNEQIEKIKTLLPSIDPSSFRPWVVGEFERIRSLIVESRNREIVNALGTHALVSDSIKVIQGMVVYLNAVDAITALRRTLQDDLFPDFPFQFEPWNPDHYTTLVNAFDEVVSMLRSINIGLIPVIRPLLSNSSDSPTASALSDLATSWDALLSLLPINSSEDLVRGRNLLDALTEDLPALLQDSGQHNSFLQFNRWQQLQTALSELNRLGLAASIPGLLAREFGPMELRTRVQRSALSQALRIRMEEGNLDTFDRKVHEQRVAAFEKALASSREILAQRIPGLAAKRQQLRRLPSGTQRGATQDLLRGLSPQRGDKTPIRDLIDKFGSALADAMPCFLMSPDSVATLLPVGSIEFDLVVFDEASQIRTSHAMGALGRGKAGIVVGDSRQMPPSTAFSSNAGAFVVDEDDDDVNNVNEIVDSGEDELEESEILAPVAAQDAESILLDFDRAKLPPRQLLCHYRSKDEVLISFSNSFIYEEPMLTFPSPAGLQSSSLRFIHVPDGQFERDKKAKPYRFAEDIPAIPSIRTNLREAELIVDEVLSRLKDPQRKARRAADPTRMAETIIVVTFNLPQMNLITELLKHKSPTLMESVMNPERPDEDTEFPPQLKIRNLENVQGDEAETVIFSVAFSKKPDGKLPLNFGPVTKPQGERRLNVAVTRAQREMIVYASFVPEDMTQGGRTISPEAVLLQQFLKLAQRGPSSMGDVGISVPTSRHIEIVADELRQLGFEVYTQLGLSSLRVDLALRRPGSAKWEIAIMVDDTCWSNRGSAFQREVLPLQVLPAMGWKRLYRIWLPAWKNSKDEILEELRSLLDADLEDEPGFGENSIDDESLRQIEDEPLYEIPDELEVFATPLPDDEPSSASADEPSEFEVFTPYSGTGPGGQDTLYALDTDPNAKKIVLAVISEILAAEAPIEANRLGRVVCKAFGFGRVTPARIEQIVKLVSRKLIHKDAIGRFVWNEEGQWETWTGYRISANGASRAAEEISAYEYRNILVDFVERSHSLSVDDAVKELAGAFGFNRVSAQIKTTFEKAINKAVSNGAVILKDGVLHPAD